VCAATATRALWREFDDEALLCLLSNEVRMPLPYWLTSKTFPDSDFPDF